MKTEKEIQQDLATALGGEVQENGTIKIKESSAIEADPNAPPPDTTPKIVIVGTGPTAIRNAVLEIENYYNSKVSPMKVYLVDHEHKHIADSTIELLKEFDEAGKLQPYIKAVAKDYIDSGKGKLFGKHGKSDQQRRFDSKLRKKKNKAQNASRKQQRRKK